MSGSLPPGDNLAYIGRFIGDLDRRVRALETLPLPTGGGAGSFGFDYAELMVSGGVVLASNDSEDLPFADTDVIDSTAGYHTLPTWLTVEFGTNLALAAGLYHVAVSGWINADIGSERISMSVKNNTSTSSPQGDYETGITAGKGSYAQGEVALMIAAQTDDHSFYVRFRSDALAASRTCKASVSIIRLGDVT